VTDVTSVPISSGGATNGEAVFDTKPRSTTEPVADDTLVDGGFDQREQSSEVVVDPLIRRSPRGRHSPGIY